ncbi:ParB/RepB/Spo0J family partition protein [Paracandidimonas soli]|uniref:ParB-like chromosome segregation protein Spo0J n=1 Tax=Paracandidimonas soli TaxID=1917182 RepID=A0A4R3V4Q9_9BURK|nr:ParB/RepB/Spo0J family partition protein [Paracandidimonas soli]TCU97294.1 ParB-like chromosome segregation protein Spo0J [Paracandidimonas soli]
MNAELDLTTAPARGNTKAAMKSAGARSADLWQVDPRLLHVMEGFNVRQNTPEYDEHIESITLSIIENGYYSDRPIAGYVARKDGENIIYVIDGHTRLAAVMRAIERGHNIETVPVVIKPAGSSMEDLTVALVKSNEGRPLAPMEIGMVCKRLLGMGLDEKTIAQRLGFSKNYIDGLLLLVGAEKPIRDLVSSGQVAATLAMQELRSDPEAAAKRLQEAVRVAHDAGKSKATKKHLPTPPRTSSPPAAEPDDQQPTPPKEIEPAFGKGILQLSTIDLLRIDEHLAELMRYHNECNSEWERIVPEMQPNEHGVFVDVATIYSPPIFNSALEIRIARRNDCWRSSVNYSLPTGGGGGSYPSLSDPAYSTATAALLSAARNLEEVIIDAMKRHPDHNRTQQACRHLYRWLREELNPSTRPLIPQQKEAHHE